MLTLVRSELGRMPVSPFASVGRAIDQTSRGSDGPPRLVFRTATKNGSRQRRASCCRGGSTLLLRLLFHHLIHGVRPEMTPYGARFLAPGSSHRLSWWWRSLPSPPMA